MLERRQRRVETEYEATSAAMLVMQAEERFKKRQAQAEEGAKKQTSQVRKNFVKTFVVIVPYFRIIVESL